MKDPARFYGYKHWTLEEVPRCFNVGKGLVNRPCSHDKRNHKWHAIVKRFGLRVEVCFGPVTNDEARAWEIENIEFEKTFSMNHSHDDTDVGCNFTRGGEGNEGWVPTKETRDNIARANKIAHNRPETKKRNSEAQKIAQNREEVKEHKSAVHKGKKLSKEQKQLIARNVSIALTGRKHSVEHREHNSEAQKFVQGREDVRKHNSEMQKLVHKRPETRAKHQRVYACRRLGKRLAKLIALRKGTFVLNVEQW